MSGYTKSSGVCRSGALHDVAQVHDYSASGKGTPIRIGWGPPVPTQAATTAFQFTTAARMKAVLRLGRKL
jgi:hypothetical protein